MADIIKHEGTSTYEEITPAERHLKLECKLTEAELAEIAERFSEKKLRALAIKDQVSALNKEKKDLEEEIEQMAKQVNTGTGEKIIKCLVVYDFPTQGMKKIKRTDTGEEWEERMNEDEMQVNQTNLFDSANVLESEDAETSEEEEVKTELQEIIESFEMNPAEFSDEYFIAGSEESLLDHNISPENFNFIEGCLVVKANFNKIKEHLDKFSPYRTFRIDHINYWYAFLPKTIKEEKK